MSEARSPGFYLERQSLLWRDRAQRPNGDR